MFELNLLVRTFRNLITSKPRDKLTLCSTRTETSILRIARLEMLGRVAASE